MTDVFANALDAIYIKVTCLDLRHAAIHSLQPSTRDSTPDDRPLLQDRYRI